MTLLALFDRCYPVDTLLPPQDLPKRGAGRTRRLPRHLPYLL